MGHAVLRRIIFISCLIPLISSRDCKWFHPKQEYLSKQILQAFNQMVGFIEGCPNISSKLTSCVFLQIEEAAIAIREVFNQTIWFYKKHHTDLQCQEKAWERLQALLYYVENLLDDCVSIPEGAENSELTHKVSDYFNILEKNVMELVSNIYLFIKYFNRKDTLRSVKYSSLSDLLFV
uniref:Uncharacterized protein n=1 Tax=Leptobrachium leishanense TaxID=445787 RepID=A0A8C5MQD3_9ANUR